MLPKSDKLTMKFDDVGYGWTDFTLSVDGRTMTWGLWNHREGMPEIIKAALAFFEEDKDQSVIFDLESEGDASLRLLHADGLFRIRLDRVRSKKAEHWHDSLPDYEFVCEPLLFVKALNQAVKETVGKYGYKGFNKGWTPEWAPHSKITTGLVKRLDELVQHLSQGSTCS